MDRIKNLVIASGGVVEEFPRNSGFVYHVLRPAPMSQSEIVSRAGF